MTRKKQKWVTLVALNKEEVTYGQRITEGFHARKGSYCSELLKLLGLLLNCSSKGQGSQVPLIEIETRLRVLVRGKTSPSELE